MAYGELNVRVVDDVTWPWKEVTLICMFGMQSMQIQNSVRSIAGNTGEAAGSTTSVSETHDPPSLKKKSNTRYLFQQISEKAQPSVNLYLIF